MPATNESTFDLDPPRRPGLADLGGARKENHPKRPPDPEKKPTAEEWNHFAKLLEKLGAIVPLARVHVKFTAGTPAIFNVVSMRNGLVALTDLTLEDHGTGDTSIRWVAPGTAGAKLPATTGAPRATQCDDIEIDRIRAFYTTVSGLPAVRVKTKLGAVATDCDFLVDIF